MEQYKGEEILFSLSAKILPTDNRVPNCVCMIRLSDKHLFVSEDNYDGSYTDHYIIDINYIEKIDVYVSEKNMAGDSDQIDSFLDGKKFRGGFLYTFFSGIRMFNGRFRSRYGSARKQYIDVVYHDDAYSVQHLYFDENDQLPKTLISKFNEIRDRR